MVKPLKEKILGVLRADGNYISGEALSQQLNVSRTAIWKHIKSLKEEGYVIDSQSRLGYKLLDVPNTLNPKEISPFLNTNFIGRKIKHFEQIESTNQFAKSIANQEPEGYVVLAEEQTKGKGRLGREWVSPKGSGIWMSIILKPNLNPMAASRLTFLAALSLVQAIRSETDLTVNIKWPNDIVWEGKKLAGVLTEMSAELDKINYVVLGTGINVNINEEEFDENLSKTATSLKTIMGKEISRKNLMIRVLEALEENYLKLLEGNFSKIIQEVKQYSTTLGSWVKVKNFNSELQGFVEDIDDEGALVLRLENGEVKRIISGDVSLRNLDGSYSE